MERIDPFELGSLYNIYNTCIKAKNLYLAGSIAYNDLQVSIKSR